MSAIHIKYPALTFKAGQRAIRQIREKGLQASDVGVLPGAAGGPKPLGIQGLDLALFGEWLPSAPRQRALIGASIGSWRFASACLDDPVAAQLARDGERIRVDENMRTSLAGVYAGGDCTALGQDLTVQAVQHGKLAAEAIHAQLMLNVEAA